MGEVLNIVSGYHIYTSDGLIRPRGELYYWRLPEGNKKLTVQQGDLVMVKCQDTEKPVIVTAVFQQTIDKLDVVPQHDVVFKIKKHKPICMPDDIAE